MALPNEIEKQELEQERVEQEKVSVEELVANLKKQGLENEEILHALEELVKTGELTEDELARAREILEGEERQDASGLFGVNII